MPAALAAASRESHAARPPARAIAVAARSGVGNIGSCSTRRGDPPMTVTATGTSVDVNGVEDRHCLVDVALVELDVHGNARVDLA